MLKAVILIGGPQKGTRFRPLSLDTPKPLFPVAGKPLIQHHIEACAALSECAEILIIGSYPTEQMQQFVLDMAKEYHVKIRYLQEFTALGTAGGLYHFRDQIRAGGPSAFFLMNGDVCADFPLKELWDFHQNCGPDALITIMGTEATRAQSLHYGCMVRNAGSASVAHYVEKPSSYVSTLINCGVYVCSLNVFNVMAKVFQEKQSDYYSNNGSSRDAGYMSWEVDVIVPLAGTSYIKCAGDGAVGGDNTARTVEVVGKDRLFVMPVTKWWSQVKTAGSAIYANRHYLELARAGKEPRYSGECTVLPDVFVHHTASVHRTAVIGPNVSIGAGVTIGAGVRLKESIVLDNAAVHEHALVMHSIVGPNATVGEWSRVEGTPSDPDPNKPFAKMDNAPLFNQDGRLNPSITILGAGVSVLAETILLNSIVLPHKQLTRSYKHEIIL